MFVKNKPDDELQFDSLWNSKNSNHNFNLEQSPSTFYIFRTRLWQI